MDERGTRTTRVDTPVVYNHNQMLKEIRNSLKHLRREPENPSETKSNGGAQVIYRGNNITNSQHRVLHVHTNHHGQFNAQRNNFVDPSRQHHEQAQGNRNYDESGYSSSSSECSSQSANDFGGQQFGGNMGDAMHQNLLSPSSFDFVRAMANNDGFKRINPNATRSRETANSITQMQFPAKSPPPYSLATQKSTRPNIVHQPVQTHRTNKVETSKYMQKTALPSGSTTISQAEWKVTSRSEESSKSSSPNTQAHLPKGGALWKSTPYSLQKQLPTSANGNLSNYQMGGYTSQQAPQAAGPQFQVQVSLNTANGPQANVTPTSYTPVVSNSPGQSATFCVSVQTSPANMADEPDSHSYSNMQSGYTRAQLPMDAYDRSRYDMMNTSPGNYMHRADQYPPPYPQKPPAPSDSSQSSSPSYYDPPPRNPSNQADQWSHWNTPSIDNMSVSSDGSESRSTIEEADFTGFDMASMSSFDGTDEDGPTTYTNKTGTLVVHVRKRPEMDVTDTDQPEDGRDRFQRMPRRHITPETYKFFMEQRMENVIKDRKERDQRRAQLEQEMQKVHLSEDAQSQMRKILNQKETNYIRLKRSKMDPSMFTKLQVIGVGAFGEVRLTKHVQSGSLYAMKILKKSEVLKRNQVAHVKAERDILAEADNEWVVKLFYSFQDTDNLYFVMEYVPGGDLMSLLIKRGFFPEEMARFYVAELVLAIESVHRMGFIHRDIKPDNVLIDSDGHIKLTDFGLCTGFRWTHDSKYYQSGTLPRNHSRNPSMDYDDNWAKEHKCRCGHAVDGRKPLARRHIRQHMRCQAHSLVGTPNYIAPEVLMRIPYTHLCDWWSVGVILYEMLVGRPPFYSTNAAETQMKVINWETTLNIPREAELSSEAEDLILQLCTSANQRLGNNGVDDIKNHPFFHGIDWLMIRKRNAYYIPQIRHAEDTSNFDPVEPDRSPDSQCDSMPEFPEGDKKPRHPPHAFYEFTFRRFFTQDQACSSVSNYSSLDETESTSEDSKAPVFV